MARKPVKKRKPRKIVKKAFKIIAVKAKPVPVKPRFKLEIGSSTDQFYINPQSIPDGIALQWVATHVDGKPVDEFPYISTMAHDAVRSGWRRVSGVDIIGGQILMWAPIDIAIAQRNRNIFTAREQMREMCDLFGMDEYGHPKEGSKFPLVSPSFMVSSNYERISPHAEPIDVEIAIKVRMSVRWQEAAACLRLTPQEYARRRLLMEPPVLGPVPFFENVYEPVQLFITRKD